MSNNLPTKPSTMAEALPEPTQRCIAAAQEKGVEVHATMFENEVPTAQAAAERLAIEIGQITNSLIFELKGSKANRRVVLVCSSGDHRVDVNKLAGVLGVPKNKVKSASPSTVLEVTGFEAGGVGPCGFLKSFEACFVDEKVFRHSQVWCGAGVKKGMLSCSPTELLIITGGSKVDVAETTMKPQILSDIDQASQECKSMMSTLPLMTFQEQLIGDGETGCRWFPERAFDFHANCPYSFNGKKSSLQVLPLKTLIKQDPGHVGGIVWDAETFLAHHMADTWVTSVNESEHTEEVSTDVNTKLPLAAKKVLELGSGTGLAGIIACLLGAHVNFTELPEGLELLTLNVNTNLKGISTGCNIGQRGTFEVNALRWGNKNSNDIDLMEEYDIILVADCVYLPEYYHDLLETIVASSKVGTLVYISFEQRRRDISAFFGQFFLPTFPAKFPSIEDRCGQENKPMRVEHEPGSDGRHPLLYAEGDPNSDGRQEPKVHIKSNGVRLYSHLSWGESQLLDIAFRISKIHLAEVEFRES